MPARALARHQGDPNAPVLGKRQRIPPKIAEAVRLLVTGTVKTQRAAAERVKMSPTYLCEALAKPKIRAFLTREVQKSLRAGTLRASARLLELLDDPSGKVSLESARLVLALDGIQPPSHPQIVNNLNIIPGYDVVLPSGIMGYDAASAPEAKVIEGEAQIIDSEN